MDDPFLLEGVERTTEDMRFLFCNGLTTDVLSLQQDLIHNGIEPIILCKSMGIKNFVYYTPKYAEEGRKGFEPDWVLNRAGRIENEKKLWLLNRVEKGENEKE